MQQPIEEQPEKLTATENTPKKAPPSKRAVETNSSNSGSNLQSISRIIAEIPESLVELDGALTQNEQVSKRPRFTSYKQLLEYRSSKGNIVRHANPVIGIQDLVCSNRPAHSILDDDDVDRDYGAKDDFDLEFEAAMQRSGAPKSRAPASTATAKSKAKVRQIEDSDDDDPQPPKRQSATITASRTSRTQPRSTPMQLDEEDDEDVNWSKFKASRR